MFKVRNTHKSWVSSTMPANSWDLMNFLFDLTMLQFILLSAPVEVGGQSGNCHPPPSPPHTPSF